MAGKFIVNEEMVSDNEGVSLGSVGGYVKRFKEQESRKGIPDTFNPKKSFANQEEDETPKQPTRKLVRPADPNMLPAEITSENEKTVYLYYYTKFGNLECNDFDKVKSKVASAINRLFKKEMMPDDALAKLKQYVTEAEVTTLTTNLYSEADSSTPFKVSGNGNLVAIKKEEKIKVDLVESEYTFIKGLSPLTPEQLDLVKFVNPKAICFSSDGYSFHLSSNPRYPNSFEKLFDFSPREELVYSMFKDQLGDEHKAKKLVLMSRMLNEPQVVETKIQSLDVVPKTSRSKIKTTKSIKE